MVAVMGRSDLLSWQKYGDSYLFNKGTLWVIPVRKSTNLVLPGYRDSRREETMK